ncbi:MAG: protein-tyrosine, partial [Gallionellaceae bacterium]
PALISSVTDAVAEEVKAWQSRALDALYPIVYMGNICRSPTAEAVFRSYVEKVGLSQHIHIDSAGTHDYHIGDAPDTRTLSAAKQRGYDMSQLRGRQVSADDFARFDYVLAMDEANLSILQSLRPHDARSHLGLFLEFAGHHCEREVPDPYYGGAQGFERVLDMVEDASCGLFVGLTFYFACCVSIMTSGSLFSAV